MQFQISTLENVKFAELTEVFNSAFADYFIEISLNEQSLAKKICAENIILAKSVGAVFDGNLVGFILIGLENKTAYNGGTGVLPEFRGHALTKQMYEFILPKLKAEGICRHQLEVITENLPAIKTYEKIGFRTVRTLACFKGRIAVSQINKTVEIKSLDGIDAQTAAPFWNSKPSWQNSVSAIKRAENPPEILGAFLGSELVGYLVFTKKGFVKQFAVKKDFRRSRIAQTLFARAKNDLDDREIVINNLDKSDRETVSFLSQIGLKAFLEQFEMQMVFK
jgi:ribosomal protein S18 acetylase RimI-like enzyme